MPESRQPRPGGAAPSEYPAQSPSRRWPRRPAKPSKRWGAGPEPAPVWRGPRRPKQCVRWASREPSSTGSATPRAPTRGKDPSTPRAGPPRPAQCYTRRRCRPARPKRAPYRGRPHWRGTATTSARSSQSAPSTHWRPCHAASGLQRLRIVDPRPRTSTRSRWSGPTCRPATHLEPHRPTRARRAGPCAPRTTLQPNAWHPPH